MLSWLTPSVALYSVPGCLMYTQMRHSVADMFRRSPLLRVCRLWREIIITAPEVYAHFAWAPPHGAEEDELVNPSMRDELARNLESFREFGWHFRCKLVSVSPQGMSPRC